MEEKLTNRQLQAIKSKNKIYNASIELLANIGFDKIGIEDICKHAGVSVGSFYTYFKSKNDILIEIFERAYNDSLGTDMIKHLYNFNNKRFITEGRYIQELLHQIFIEAEKKKNFIWIYLIRK